METKPRNREVVIYQIINKNNPKRVYLGCTVNFPHRKAKHFSELRNGQHASKLMLADFEKGDSFEISIVETFDKTFTAKQLKVIEKAMIRLTKPFYNVKSKKSYKFKKA